MATIIESQQQAQTLIAQLDPQLTKMQMNREYQRGDHWQSGAGWGGPPIPGDMLQADETTSQAAKDLTPIPIISEGVERYVTGLLGDEPAFEVVLARALEEGQEPTPEEAADMADFNDALTKFWDGRGALEKTQDMVDNLCSGRGTLRPFIPPELPEFKPKDLLQAMDALYIEAPEWEYCGVYTDPRSMREYGIYLYENQYVNEKGETVYKPRCEVTTVLDNGKTQFSVIEDGKVIVTQEYDCGGNIWVFQAVDKKPLIKEPQRKIQKTIDFLNTILPKNAQYAGYRERHFLNVKRNVDDAGAPIDPQLGPTTVNFWQATEYDAGDGVMKPGAASLVLGEPVNSQPIRDDIMHMNHMFLQSVYQEHVMISGDSTASAVSRVQARAGFANSLLRNKPKVEKMLRDMFMMVLCLGCELSNQKDKLQRLKTDYRIRVDVKPNSGPLSPEEQLAVVQFAKERVISYETAQTMLGVEDVDAEAQKLLQERDTSQEYLENQAKIIQTLAAANAPLKEAALLAGVDEDTADRLSTDFVEETNNGAGTEDAAVAS